MKPTELNYPTQHQELLVIINALAAFRIYYLDKPPIVETDHKSLDGLFTQKMANRRLARWYDILAEYQPTFSYLPGARNGIADALSRRLDLQPETKFFHDLSITSFNDTDVVVNADIISKIKKAYNKDREVRTILAAIKQRSATLKPKERKQHRKLYRCYFEEHGLLRYQSPADDNPRIVVPNDVKLSIGECHGAKYGGHAGTERTYLTLARH
ncbi:putative retroelement [Phytophthora palmivora]|uniref:Retroelement n=1 Tax=Phytophthora palmivora TaxID=4796 RepID=A0A2P4X2L9_9STRA|nr:putative retroelement [Phytophthora palmivora]